MDCLDDLVCHQWIDHPQMMWVREGVGAMTHDISSFNITFKRVQTTVNHSPDGKTECECD